MPMWHKYPLIRYTVSLPTCWALHRNPDGLGDYWTPRAISDYAATSPFGQAQVWHQFYSSSASHSSQSMLTIHNHDPNLYDSHRSIWRSMSLLDMKLRDEEGQYRPSRWSTIVNKMEIIKTSFICNWTCHILNGEMAEIAVYTETFGW